MNKKEPLISVIIPTYNRANTIKRTIESVLSQTYKNFELIIVDDASTDNTQDIVKNFNDQRIKYTKLLKNTNGTKPRNIGIELSKGQFIAFLDSDDTWISNKLEKQLNYIINKNCCDSDFLCFTNLIIKKGSKVKYSQNESLKENEDIMDYILVGDNLVQTSTFMLPARTAKSVLFDSSLKKHQDWDFCLRLRKSGVKFLFFSEYLSIWNQDNEDRISKSFRNDEISLNWINSSNELSKKADLAFRAKFVAPYLAYKSEFNKSFKLILTAYSNRAITFKSFIIILTMCLLPEKVICRVKQVMKNWNNN